MFGRFILAYLRFFARLQLRKNPQATIIGVTGSAGKTSTRLAIVKILAGRGRVKQSAHANSESGIPLNILGLSMTDYSLIDWLRVCILAPLRVLTYREAYDYYVVEMGIDGPHPPKNMRYLLSIVRPHIAVVTSIGLVHAAAFDHLVKDRDPVRRMQKIKLQIAHEKMYLARALGASGVAVVNGDVRELTTYLPELNCRVITYGHTKKVTLKTSSVQISARGFRASYTVDGAVYSVTNPGIFPAHYADTFGAALGVAKAIGIPIQTAARALATYQAPAGRMRVFTGIKQTRLLDASYNASPASMTETLQLGRRVAGRGRVIGILGDMRELGSSSRRAHQDLAKEIERSLDVVYLFGPETGAYTYPRLFQAGFPVQHFTQMSELIRTLRAELPARAWVVIKGSQNTILLERAVAALLADPADRARLCRRGAYWDKIRAQTP